MFIIKGITDVGRKRAGNEDAFYGSQFADNIAWAVVCDGMGGANGGHIASSMAVDIIKKNVKANFRADMNANSIRSMLFSAVLAANAQVYHASEQEPSLKGMGTTVVACFMREDTLHVVHAGDSRAYMIEKDSIVQLTKDHSLVQVLVEKGQITSEEARQSPDKNLITRALGIEEEIELDYAEFDIPLDAKILICTDGLSNLVTDEEIQRIVLENPVETACEVLVEQANDNDGTDNITAVLISR